MKKINKEKKDAAIEKKKEKELFDLVSFESTCEISF